jgi:hypothetical protein
VHITGGQEYPLQLPPEVGVRQGICSATQHLHTLHGIDPVHRPLQGQVHIGPVEEQFRLVEADGAIGRPGRGAHGRWCARKRRPDKSGIL